MHFEADTFAQNFHISPNPPVIFFAPYPLPDLENRVLRFEGQVSIAASFLQTLPLSGSQTGGIRPTSVIFCAWTQHSFVPGDPRGWVCDIRGWGLARPLAVPSVRRGINLVSMGCSADGEVEDTVVCLTWWRGGGVEKQGGLVLLLHAWFDCALL